MLSRDRMIIRNNFCLAGPIVYVIRGSLIHRTSPALSKERICLDSGFLIRCIDCMPVGIAAPSNELLVLLTHSPASLVLLECKDNVWQLRDSCIISDCEFPIGLCCSGSTGIVSYRTSLTDTVQFVWELRGNKIALSNELDRFGYGGTIPFCSPNGLCLYEPILGQIKLSINSGVHECLRLGKPISFTIQEIADSVVRISAKTIFAIAEDESCDLCVIRDVYNQQVLCEIASSVSRIQGAIIVNNYILIDLENELKLYEMSGGFALESKLCMEPQRSSHLNLIITR